MENGTRVRIAGLLGSLPHFRDLDEDLLGELVAASRLLRHGSEEILFAQGEPCAGIHVVLEGAVRLYRLTLDGNEQVVQDFGPRQVFAEAALFQASGYPVHAKAVREPTLVVRIDRARFLDLLKLHPALSMAMLQAFAGHLQRLVDRVQELSVASASMRLAGYLLRLRARAASEAQRELVLELPMRKRDLAAYLSIAPETLSRIFARWRQRSLLEVEGSRIRVRDPALLELVADGQTP